MIHIPVELAGPQAKDGPPATLTENGQEPPLCACVSAARLRAVSPAGPLGERLHADRGEHLVRGAQLPPARRPPAVVLPGRPVSL